MHAFSGETKLGSTGQLLVCVKSLAFGPVTAIPAMSKGV